MKPSKKIMLLTSCALAIFALVACGTNQKQTKEKQESSTVQQSYSDKEHYKGTYSNLNNKASVEEVRTLLSAYLDQDSVDKFLGLVTDYDSIVGSVGLTGDFSKFKKTDYNVEKISDLWTKQKGDFVGTNCRINSYTLLKNRIEIPKMKADSELLFVDVGVLVPAKDGYLFVEKLTFEEPYQAIKFATKEDVYKYLETKYQDYTGEGLAKPFIMDNEKWVEMK